MVKGRLHDAECFETVKWIHFLVQEFNFEKLSSLLDHFRESTYGRDYSELKLINVIPTLIEQKRIWNNIKCQLESIRGPF